MFTIAVLNVILYPIEIYRQKTYGQDQARDAPAEAVGEPLIALDRKPGEVNGEDVDQRIADHEYRHREAQYRDAHHQVVYPGALPIRRYSTQRHGQEHRQHHGAGGQGQGRLDAVQEQFADLFLEEEGFTEVPAEDQAEPDDELLRDGLVKPQPPADLGHLFRGGVVAGNDGGRVARGEAQEEEDEHRHHGHHRDGGEQPAGDVGVHRLAALLLHAPEH